MPLRPDGHRDFVLVSRPLYEHYWACRKRIFREWYGAGFGIELLAPGVREAMDASYEELRAEIRSMAPYFAPNDTDERGVYLIPV